MEKFSHIDDWMRRNDNAYLKYLEKELRTGKGPFMLYQIAAVREWQAENGK
tara:strand:+ start:961 stop:1113 length:153 start_codon:yes stop_codon:yes gene_type:complete